LRTISKREVLSILKTGYAFASVPLLPKLNTYLQEFITSDVKSSPAYDRMVENLRNSLARLFSLLNDRSIPFYSPRYAAHMTFEPSLPSIAGWMSAMLLNPNNVSFQASPITTLLELEVGKELCKMIGFKDSPEEGEEWNEGQMEGDIRSWGHLTTDGTVANIEAIWAGTSLLLPYSTPKI
jgi:glutamate/tyrosine decarboxylase-like PLP-dependent enzyme